MSLAYFDDTAVLSIRSDGGSITRTLKRVKTDYVRGETADRATLYIPLYGKRDMRYVPESEWDEETVTSRDFTVRPGDTFVFYNDGRNGCTPVGSVYPLTVTEVTVNTRGSRRMRHIKAVGVCRHGEEE